MPDPQEPRTGGVAVRRAAIDSDWAGEAFFTRRLRNPFSKDEWVDTHIAFPLAEAESLIDPNDEGLENVIARAIYDTRAQGLGIQSQAHAVVDAMKEYRRA